MRARILCLLSVISVSLALAQQSRIAGPVSGYVFDDSARGLRPILGMPGASLLGDPLSFGLEVSSAAVAPRQDAAFVTAADGSFHLFRIQSAAPTELIVNGLSGAPEQVVFSPAGTAAALQVNGSIQIISGLPDSPAIAATVDASPYSGPNALAVSDDGAALLLASGNSVELFGGAADLGKLTDTAGLALVAFAPGGHDAAIADRAGAGLVLYRGLTGAMVSQPVAPSDQTIQSASALAFSTDGQRLLLANSPGQSVTTFDLSAGARSTVSCDCSPSALARTGDLFRLNEIGSGPIWLLDARTATASLTFVPAAPDPRLRQRPTRPGAPRRGLSPVEETVLPAPRVRAANSE